MKSTLLHNGIACTVAAIAALTAVSPAAAQILFHRKGQQQCAPCLPPHWELAPIKPDTLPKKDIESPDPSKTPDVAPMDPGFDAGMSVAGLGQTASVPNIFGSLFGRGGGQASVSVIRPGALSGRAVSGIFFNGNQSPNGTINIPAGAPATVELEGFPDLNTASPQAFSQDGFPASGAGGTIQVFPGAPPLTFQQISALLIQQGQADLIPLAGALFQVANSGEQLLDPSATLLAAGIGPVTATAAPAGGQGPQSFDLIYDTIIQTMIKTQLLIDVPSPAGGGVVGRTQIAEDNNPLPQDRILFNYDYFDNVPLNRQGVDVNRFVFGIEKTFLNQMASIQLRLPFAGTLDSTQRIGSGDRNTELGNLHILLKVLLLAGERGAISTGLGISTPTADDTSVQAFNGQEVVRIKNESVLLQPFIAAMVNPTPRTFAQIWASWDFDTNGNPVYVNPTLSPGGLRRAGHLNDQTLILISAQMGAWAYQSQNANTFLRGLAPFIELHYIDALGDADIIRSGSFIVGNMSGNYNELDLTAGVLADLGPRGTFSVGVVSPLLTDEDRSFDYQIGFRLNIFFGPSLQTRQNRITPFTF